MPAGKAADGSFDIAAAFAVHYAEQDKSSAIATLKTLIDFLAADTSGSVTELSKNIRSAINTLKELDCRTEVESVAEIYFRFITLRAEKFEVRVVVVLFLRFYF